MKYVKFHINAFSKNSFQLFRTVQQLSTTQPSMSLSASLSLSPWRSPLTLSRDVPLVSCQPKISLFSFITMKRESNIFSSILCLQRIWNPLSTFHTYLYVASSFLWSPRRTSEISELLAFVQETFYGIPEPYLICVWCPLCRLMSNHSISVILIPLCMLIET